jgi:hypothetical protein
MAFDSLIGPVKHGSGLQIAFKSSESVFYLIKVFIMIQDHCRINIPNIGCNR